MRSYYHACIDCREMHDERDKDVRGKDVLIFDDGGWFCRDCWKVMDAKRDAELEAQESAA